MPDSREKPAGTGSDAEPTVQNRWWVDQGGREKFAAKRPAGPAGSKFFRVAHDFEQERARNRLTDNNWKVLAETDPPEGGWAYVRFAETTFPRRELERIKSLVNLPPYARGVIVDCGRSIRILVTGTPIGERVLELAVGESPSFDCWVGTDWVREEVFEDGDRALKALRRFIRQWLSPEAIVHHEQVKARA